MQDLQAASGAADDAVCLRSLGCRVACALVRLMALASAEDSADVMADAGFALSVLVELLLEARGCRQVWASAAGSEGAFRATVAGLADGPALPNGVNLDTACGKWKYTGTFNFPTAGVVAAALLLASRPGNLDLRGMVWASAAHLLKDRPVPFCWHTDGVSRPAALIDTGVAHGSRHTWQLRSQRRQIVAVIAAMCSSDLPDAAVRLPLCPMGGILCWVVLVAASFVGGDMAIFVLLRHVLPITRTLCQRQPE